MIGCNPGRISTATPRTLPVRLAVDAKGLKPEEITIDEVLESAGDKTGIFGRFLRRNGGG